VGGQPATFILCAVPRPGHINEPSTVKKMKFILCSLVVAFVAALAIAGNTKLTMTTYSDSACTQIVSYATNSIFSCQGLPLNQCQPASGGLYAMATSVSEKNFSVRSIFSPVAPTAAPSHQNMSWIPIYTRTNFCIFSCVAVDRSGPNRRPRVPSLLSLVPITALMSLTVSHSGLRVPASGKAPAACAALAPRI
jgi:hypothetical protein